MSGFYDLLDVIYFRKYETNQRKVAYEANKNIFGIKCKGDKIMKEGFITPSNHLNFEAKKLFGEVGRIIDGSIAYINLKGGGPIEKHTHEHNHLFIVTQGEAKVLLGEEVVVIKKDEAFLVEGKIPHSVWSNQDEETVMIGISVLC